MNDLSADRIDEIVESIARDHDGEISLVDLLGISKLMIESLESMISYRDTELGSEVNSIARHIERTQVELGLIPPRAVASAALPDADEDLREVVRSTEAATQSILHSAERIMAADSGDIDGYRQVVDDAVVSIFEACCFQDLTGQRIRRVVETLSYVNEHINFVMDLIERGTNKGLCPPERLGAGLAAGPPARKSRISQAAADAVFDAPESNVVPLKSR